MLRLEDLSFFVHNNGESKHILSNINLEIQRGKLYGITGPNGGGKTTLAKVIMGILPHTAGHIYLDGEDISDKNITERANLGIAYAFQQPPRFKGLTVEVISRKLLSLSTNNAQQNIGSDPFKKFDLVLETLKRRPLTFKDIKQMSSFDEDQIKKWVESQIKARRIEEDGSGDLVFYRLIKR